MPLRLLAAFALIASSATAAVRSEYRGFWVDTFNTSLNNHADIEAVVAAARSARANALFVQVRRRADAWYLNAQEPLPDFVPIAQGFDPLYDLVQTAHSAAIEVHAFVILGAIWNKNPTFAPSATLGPPQSSGHVFNRHGGFNASTGRIEPGPDNWLTRTLLPDGAAGITFQGHRFGSDFWLDFGHPDAAGYTVDVLTHLVKTYDIDGLHLDRIRYPDFSAAGQTPATGANVGYNAVSVWRFQEHHGIPHDDPPPEPGDARWAQWRRDQVTNVVRRIYLNAVAVRPRIIVSAALIAFGAGPVASQDWLAAEAYWRVYQDWRAWTEEGIIDIAMPMNYKRESIVQQATWFDQWNQWSRTHQYNRAAVSGLGVYLNAIEGSVRQVRRALDAPAEAPPLKGVVFYALANPDTAVMGNPHALPSPSDTPVRGIAEFASALTTGRSLNGLISFDADPSRSPIFAETALIPRLAWKDSPQTGHGMGFARRSDGSAFDTANVYLYDSLGQLRRIAKTDGGGFFGAVDLPSDRWTAIVELRTERVVSHPVPVEPGKVSVFLFP